MHTRKLFVKNYNTLMANQHKNNKNTVINNVSGNLHELYNIAITI